MVTVNLMVFLIALGASVALGLLVGLRLGLRLDVAAQARAFFNQRIVQEARINMLAIEHAARNPDAMQFNKTHGDSSALRHCRTLAENVVADLARCGLSVEAIGFDSEKWALLMGNLQRNITASGRPPAMVVHPAPSTRPDAGFTPLRLLPIGVAYAAEEMLDVERTDEHELWYDTKPFDISEFDTDDVAALTQEETLEFAALGPSNTNADDERITEENLSPEMLEDRQSDLDVWNSDVTDVAMLPATTWSSLPPLPHEHAEEGHQPHLFSIPAMKAVAETEAVTETAVPFFAEDDLQTIGAMLDGITLNEEPDKPQHTAATAHA